MTIDLDIPLRYLLIGCLTAVVATGVYLVVFSVAISPGPETATTTPPGPDTDIEFDGQFEMTESEFQARGAIISNPSSGASIGNISVYIYSDDETLVERRSVGEANSGVNISLRVDSAPEYVIIDSPEFWSRPGINPLYYHKDGTFDGQPNYQSRLITSKQDFPEFHRETVRVQSSGR
ncbi:hypothetical protein C475_00110 [Halosimplex carlsbadense 2-9-1]|uniref:Uncharacterized protein n=1 Tax=Halosimplex carlsbadense 2-9-1 TaxID=797114 RepID=M0D4Z1_9EURY|nr:hypothetical protein [Halosimplex carlsbadense]ELZ30500.1 hypothetical protein C475_00110 [Halosimplex carlsbadense 2-9-1]